MPCMDSLQSLPEKMQSPQREKKIQSYEALPFCPSPPKGGKMAELRKETSSPELRSRPSEEAPVSEDRASGSFYSIGKHMRAGATSSGTIPCDSLD